MRIGRPRTRRGWIAAAVAGLALAATLFWVVAPYNIAASVPHLPVTRWLLDGYLQNAVRTWSLGIEPPSQIDLDDPALIARGAAHFESGCAPCHGAPGRSRNPVVRGMRPEPPDLSAHVREYADRELYWIVQNGFKYTAMPAWAAQRRPEEPWALAAFLRRYPGMVPATYHALAYGPVEEFGPLASGEAIAFGGLNDRLETLVQNCARCHGLDGLGRDGVAPKLAGQSAAYLEATLRAYAEAARASGFMQPIAATLSQEERAGLARFYAEMDAPAPEAADPALVAEGAALAREGAPRRDVPACVACHGSAAEPPAREPYPRLAGQDRRWLETWLRLWRERRRGGTEYAHIMHEAARTLTDAQIGALAAFYAAGAPAQEATAARP